MSHFASAAVRKVEEELEVSLSSGLSQSEVQERLLKYGKNALPEVPSTPWWKLFLAQFDDGLVRILLAAAAVSFAMACLESNYHGFVEPLVILLILCFNAIVGVWQESNAESAIEELKSFVASTAHALRDGNLVTVAAEDLVPGDVVEVAVGNRVPADIRVCTLLSTTLRADQAILTGESCEIMKHDEKVAAGAERYPTNMLFSGTSIVYGKARGIVTSTGASTEIGHIEKDVREQDDQKTPLQMKLDEFGELLSKVIGWICLLVFFVNLARWFFTSAAPEGEGVFVTHVQPMIHCLKVAVALAVAAIPEGLPAVVTTCLALGTRKMARHHALVRELPSVETLGCCTVICSDKTGTLTTNLMSVAEVLTLENSGKGIRKYTIDDSSYNVIPNAVKTRGVVVHHPTSTDAALEKVSQIASLCNDASLEMDPQGNVRKLGEATEAALKTLAEKLDPTVGSIDAVSTKWANTFSKNMTLEFTRERKSMSVHCSHGRSHTLFVKGAPEAILERCSTLLTAEGKEVKMTAEIRASILQEVQAMSCGANTLRCIGFAQKSVPSKLPDATNPAKFSKIESEMTFCGVSGMLDPPRAEVRDAIAACNSAGIRVVVITGDNKDTAEAICRRIGVFDDGECTEGKSFTGKQFNEMSDSERHTAVRGAKLFSRTDPSHKMAIVDILQKQKSVCAMTGDGVNDAPALKKADIGIAMGTGTEVAKAASKMVLANDNFATIVHAVAEGRAIYNNTKQFIRYLISSNIGEVVCILITGLCGIPDALEPVQLLWVNLVTDGLPATALGFNPPDPDIMEHPPRGTDEPIVNGWLFFRYMVVGVYVGLATVGGFVWWFLYNGYYFAEITGSITCSDVLSQRCMTLSDPREARAVALSILVVVEMFNALNALSENQSIVTVRPTRNKWLLLAIVSSMALHFLIMYLPVLADIFAIAPLGATVEPNADPWTFVVPTSFVEWKAIVVFSFPVILLDELLKYFTRLTTKKNE